MFLGSKMPLFGTICSGNSGKKLCVALFIVKNETLNSYYFHKVHDLEMTGSGEWGGGVGGEWAGGRGVDDAGLGRG